jgi:hypothetical protein
MRPFRSGLAAALALTMMPLAARAEEPTEEVTVHGSQAAGFASRARIDDAPREITDAASLIEPLPGVHVRRFGADDAFATLSIRGSTSSEVAILLAGVPLTGAADPSLDLATLPIWPGVRVRVYRSFAPAALGPGSLGGTLVVDPPRPTARVGTEVWAAAGSFGARRLRVGDVRALGAGGARLVTALSASRADDDFTYYDPIASTPGHDVTSTRTNTQHAAVNGLASVSLPVRFDAAHVGSLTVTTLAQARRQHVPGTIKAPTPSQVLDANRALAAIELSGPTSDGAWSVRAWGRRDGLQLRDDRSQLATFGPTHTDDRIVAAGGSIGWRGALADPLSLEARADASGERFAPGSYVGGAAPAGATRAAAGAALDVEWQATRIWAWTASGRADVWSDGSNDPTVASRSEARPTGHLGTEVQAGPLVLAAHGGAVARPPSFVERFGDRGAFIGDPDLRPESAWTVDAGARLVARRIGPVRLRAEIAGFATWADDLIVFVSQGAYGRARATNIGRARLVGAEAEVVAAAYGLEARAAYTALATANEAACAVAGGSIASSSTCARPQLPGRPEHDLVMDVSYTFGALRLRYGVDAVSGIVADLTGNVRVPARVLQSIGVRFDVPGADGLRLALDVRNLLDVRNATYEGIVGPVREPIGDAYQYPLPGRSFLVSARFAR